MHHQTRVKNLFFLLSITLLNHPSLYAHSSTPTAKPNRSDTEHPLCRGDEQTLWRCVSGTKVYALCASPQFNKLQGYLQFRIGKHGTVLLRYPKGRVEPKGRFRYSVDAAGNASITFRNGPIRYDLIDSLRGRSLIRLYKEPGNKMLTQIRCENPNQTLQLNTTIRWMEEAGISRP